jgi:hypothetical protein
MRHNLEVDITDLLPTIGVPTLVLHRTDETWIDVEYGRYAARKIPGARLVELPGTDHYIWEQNSDAVAEEIEEFLTGVRRGRGPERSLKTVVFTDIVGSTGRAREVATSDGASSSTVTRLPCIDRSLASTDTSSRAREMAHSRPSTGPHVRSAVVSPSVKRCAASGSKFAPACTRERWRFAETTSAVSPSTSRREWRGSGRSAGVTDRG